MSNLSDKLTSFGQFLTLLSGQFDIRVTTKDHPLPNALVLPNLEQMSETDLDVLYGLCLREAGTLSKSQRRTEFLRKLSTKRELQAATLVDQARTERFLTRKFGGAGEILLTHFGKLAHNPSYTKIIMGLEPKKATSDQVFLFAFKWHMLGCPKFGWDKLFDQKVWDQACLIINKYGQELLATPLRKYEDALLLSKEALALWYKKTKTQDASAQRGTSKEEKAYEKALKDIEDRVRKTAQAFQERIDAEKDKAQKIREKLEQKKEEMQDVLNPLKDKLDDLKEKRQEFSSVKNELRQMEKMSSCEQSLSQKEEKTQEKVQHLSEKKDDLAMRAENTATPDLSSLEEKKKELEKQIEEKRKHFDEQHASLEDKRQELEKQLQEATTDKKKEALQDKLNKLEEKSTSLEQKQQDWEKRLAERMEALDNRAQNKEDRAKERSEKLEERAKDAQQKLDDLKKQLDQLTQEKQAAQQKQHQAEQALKEALKKAGVSNNQSSIDDLVNEMNQSMEEYQKTQSEWEKATRPLESLKQAFQEATKKANQEAKKGRWETEKALHQIEKELAQQGVDLDLTEKMEEMEGWDQANKAQEDFDRKASEKLQMSVINGVGGGRGNRDMMLLVEDTLSALHEVDPNAIFEDVQKLSPLAGFAAGSGKNEADLSSSKNNQEQESVFTQKSHTVWSKKFDRVIQAPVKKASVVQKLRATNKKEIDQVKKIFLSKMKPSFKPKFVGNKEEGDLDSRSLWKFAANQGDDFFEVVKKRPVTKGSASIVVDLSGSMEASSENASEKLQKLVLLLSEGLSACHIPHEVLGYYAPIDENLSNQDIPSAFNRKSCRLETVVIKDVKDKSLHGLASLSVQQADNSDGESVRVALNRLLKQAGTTKMMFLISDGKPYMQDSDCDILDADLQKAVMEATNKKVVVAGLGFAKNHPVLGSSYIELDEANMVQSIEKLFGDKK